MRNSDELDCKQLSVSTKYVATNILVLKTTTSTNDIACEYAAGGENDGLAVFAEEQIAGRGRGTNKWQTGVSDSITCSVILKDKGYSPELLSLSCAVAAAEAIGKLAGQKVTIKWTNDIIINNKKISGILVESKEHNDCRTFIIGIGIN